VKKHSRPPSQTATPEPAAPGQSPGAVETPSLAAIVVATFNRLNFRSRARMLGRLLAGVGPLALTVVGGGAFAKYVTHARWQEIPVSIDDAARATSGQIYDIVRYVEQSDPHMYSQLLNVLARDPATIAALGAAIAALTLNRLAGRSGTGHSAATPSRRRPERRMSGSNR